MSPSARARLRNPKPALEISFQLSYAAAVALTARQRQHLRALAHAQKPLVQIGAKGIGDSLIEQIREQLAAHELIKVRFNTESAVEPAEAAGDLLARTKSELVQKSGRILVLYRRHDEKPKIELPRTAQRKAPSGTAPKPKAPRIAQSG